MNVPISIFVVSLGLVAYIYAGYPALVAVRARMRPRPVHRAPVRPPVTVIIPAFNEAGVIEAKIWNTFALDYPADRLEILIVSDGSTDETEAIVRRYESPRLRLLVQARQGKAFALNRAARAAANEILVFTDANTELGRDALAHLVESFADPEVGGVAGNKRYRPAGADDGTGRGEGSYWRFDSWQKLCESRAGSVFAADGALYAVRRDLYVPIRDPAQADDMAISVQIVLQGHRLVFEPQAIAYEEAPGDRFREFGRKVRITNHSLRALLNLRRKLWTSGFYSVQLLSHKFVRHLSPVLLLMLLLSSGLLARSSPLFQLALAGQLGLYGLGALGLLIGRGTARAGRFLVMPAYFCLVNAAALRGIVAVLQGRRLRVWTPRGDGGDASPDAAGDADEPESRQTAMATRILGCVLVMLTASAGPATGQSPPRPDPHRPSPNLYIALSLASIYDSNLDYIPNALPSYGALAGVDARFLSRPDRPALRLDYSANVQSYSRTDRWDRISQRGRATLAARLGSAWTLDVLSSFALLGATEDRELVDELVVGPRLEYRGAATSVLVSGGQQFRRDRDGGLDTKADFGAVELRGRLAGRHGWGTSYRYERMDSDDPGRRNIRSTYGAQYSRSLFTRGWLGIGLRYRAQQYPERMVRMEEQEVPRQDRGWQAYGTWVTSLRPGPEVLLQYRYESRQSNVPWAVFDAHNIMLSLRQPITFGGSRREVTQVAAPPPPAERPLPAPAAPRFAQASLGGQRACALTEQGSAHCWQSGSTLSDTTSGTAVSPTLRFSSIAVGASFACGVTDAGRTYCWGGSYPGSPTELRTTLRFASLAAGAAHICGLTADGRAYCWGSNRSGALGSASPDSPLPVPVAGGHRFRLLTAGWQHTCGLTGDGVAYCWGGNRQGELGALFASGGLTPALVTGGHRFAGLSAGGGHTCGVTPEGSVLCWGANAWGQLGNGSTVTSRAPAAVDANRAFADVSAGVDHTCALTRNGELYCWGRNDRGQVDGDSGGGVQSTPLRAGGGARFRYVVASAGTCAITAEAQLRCWGEQG
jgi:GT2 family glycosyltransferase